MHIPTIEDVVRPYMSYPAVVQQALIRVETHPSLRVLSRSHLKILKALVTRCSKSNGLEPVRARIDRLAQEASVSEKTVQRALALFSKIGWVRQVTCGRSEYGLFCAREYQFSPELCGFLELPVPVKALKGRSTKDRSQDTVHLAATTVPPSPVAQHNEAQAALPAGLAAGCPPVQVPGVEVVHPMGDSADICSNSTAAMVQSTGAALANGGTMASVTSDRSDEAVGKPEASDALAQGTKMSDGVYIDLSFKSDQQRIREQLPAENRITLPEPLRALQDFGLKATGICKLMRLASAAGYRLEHIFRVARDRIIALGVTGSRVYRYLLAMIGRRSDYAGRAEQIARIEAESTRMKTHATRAERYRYKQYRGQGGLAVRIFDGTAEVRKGDGTFFTLTERDMGQVYDAIEAGKLQEVEC